MEHQRIRLSNDVSLKHEARGGEKPQFLRKLEKNGEVDHVFGFGRGISGVPYSGELDGSAISQCMLGYEGRAGEMGKEQVMVLSVGRTTDIGKSVWCFVRAGNTVSVVFHSGIVTVVTSASSGGDGEVASSLSGVT